MKKAHNKKYFSKTSINTNDLIFLYKYVIWEYVSIDINLQICLKTRILRSRS